MKKKIKDITFFDVNEVCLKHSDCNKCPLSLPHWLGGKHCIISIMYHCLKEEMGDYLEIEVEL